MKRLSIALLMLLLVAPAILAQDEKPDNEAKPEVVLRKLYATEGRAWNYRIIHWSRGESPVVETTSDCVAKIKDGKAEIKGDTFDFEGDVMETRDSFLDLDGADDDEKALVADDLPLETLDMGFRKFECRKLVRKDDGVQVTTWTSTEYHPLIVKQVTFEGDYTEIRKLTSFVSAERDPWLLYRMDGRHWKTKTTIKLGGVNQTNYSEYSVSNVTDSSADYTVLALDAQGTVVSSTTLPIEFKQVSTAQAPAKPPTIEEKECEAGTFECYLTVNNGTKIWSSTVWTGLTVALEMKGVTSELVEFDLGHDAMKLYRAAGNSYTMHSVTDTGGMKVESYTTYNITKVENGTSTFELVSKDGNGREVFRSESGLELTDAPDHLTPYAKQVEELIETPAGKFPAIRTETGENETVTWTWHGIAVKTQIKMDGITMVMEVTELKME